MALYTSPQSVTCLAPAHAQGLVGLAQSAHAQGLVGLALTANGMVVRVDNGNSSSGSSSSVSSDSASSLPFTYLGSPIVQGIYPHMGVVGGGDVVTIYGQGWLSLTNSDQMVPTAT